MSAEVSFRVVTLNLLHESKHSTWPLRAPLVAEELSVLSPDIVLLQEVAWPNEQATTLSHTIGKTTGIEYAVHLTELLAANGWQEGLAILSRFPIVDRSALQFPGSEKFCQRVRLHVHGKTLDIYNVHLDPYMTKRVREQVQAILRWMETYLDTDAIVFGGDFNAPPHDEAITQLHPRFRSAYALVHGREPDYTVPTPFRIELRRRQNLPLISSPSTTYSFRLPLQR